MQLHLTFFGKVNKKVGSSFEAFDTGHSMVSGVCMFGLGSMVCDKGRTSHDRFPCS